MKGSSRKRQGSLGMGMPKKKVACVSAGLWFAGGLASCGALSSPSCPRYYHQHVVRSTSGGSRASYTSFRARRPRATREGSAVDLEPIRSMADSTSQIQTQPIRWRQPSEPGTAVLDAEQGAASPALLPPSGSIGGERIAVVSASVDFDSAIAEGSERRRQQAKGKEPELLEGDRLENTPKMIFLTYFSLGLNALYLLQALSMISSPSQAFWTAATALAGLAIADLVSGVFHWSVDNYGDGNTPVFGTVIEAFQGHHVSPWTITYRPFENNVHKIVYAVLPLLALLRWANPGPVGVALGVTFLVGSLMSQECHRYAHMTEPPSPVRFLQGLGVMVSRREHGQHHSSPFEEKYCIVSGVCNGPLDYFRVFRFLERIVYQVNGVEPIAWKLDATVKEEALLTTRWLSFADRATPE